MVLSATRALHKECPLSLKSAESPSFAGLLLRAACRSFFMSPSVSLARSIISVSSLSLPLNLTAPVSLHAFPNELDSFKHPESLRFGLFAASLALVQAQLDFLKQT